MRQKYRPKDKKSSKMAAKTEIKEIFLELYAIL